MWFGRKQQRPPTTEEVARRTVGGKAYCDLSAEEWANVTSISTERHFALNWVSGLAPQNRWDETPTAT